MEGLGTVLFQFGLGHWVYGMRCFIAIELAPELRESVWEATAPMRRAVADVKWVAQYNYHLTLKFLGETPEAEIEGICKALEKAVSGIEGFDIEFEGLGVFPDERRPRVIWVGINPPDRLKAVQAGVERELTAIGIKADDKEFHPHLTIGRVRSNRGVSAMGREIARMNGVKIGMAQVRSIALMKSELNPEGPVYTRICEIPLIDLNNNSI